MRIGLVLLATAAVLFAGCSVRGNVCDNVCYAPATVTSAPVSPVAAQPRVIRRVDAPKFVPTARTADVRAASNFTPPPTPSVRPGSTTRCAPACDPCDPCAGGSCGIPDPCCPGGNCGIPSLPNPFECFKLPSPCSPCKK